VVLAGVGFGSKGQRDFVGDDLAEPEARRMQRERRDQQTRQEPSSSSTFVDCRMTFFGTEVNHASLGH
jgi:hypothetical protein